MTRFVGIGEIGAGADQYFLEPAHEFDGAKTFAQDGRGIRRSTGESSKIEDGIADDLSRTVESNVSAAIAFVKLYAALGQEFGRCNHIGSLRIAPESNDGGVLQQQQHIADLLRFSQLNQLLLQAQTGGVVNGAELDERDQSFPTSNFQFSLPIWYRNPAANRQLEIDNWQWNLCVDRHSIHTIRCVEHGLGQSRVGMDGPHQVFHSGFEFHGGNGFGDQFGSLWD